MKTAHINTKKSVLYVVYFFSVNLHFSKCEQYLFSFFLFQALIFFMHFLSYRKPPTYKSVIQANGSAKKKHKEEKPPDLWINHTDHVEMKPINPAPDVTDTIPR